MEIVMEKAEQKQWYYCQKCGIVFYCLEIDSHQCPRENCHSKEIVKFRMEDTD